MSLTSSRSSPPLRAGSPGIAPPIPASSPAVPVSELVAHECGAGAPPTQPLWVSIKFEEVIAAATMSVLALVTMANVLSRYVIEYSLAFTEEYSIALLQIMVLMGVSAAIARNSHIRMTFLTEKLGSGAQRWLAILGDVAVLLCLGVVVVYGTRITVESWRIGEVSPGLGHPQWVYVMWLPLLSAVACLRSLGALLRQLRHSTQD